MDVESSKDLLAYTPMFHARLFKETAKFRDHHFQPTKKGMSSQGPSAPDNEPSNAFLDGHPIIDRPLFVQFCANEPDDFLEAAKYVQHYCDAVDLNLGCPQGIAKKGAYGAFLQEDWDRIYSLIHALHENLDVPVTAKMRILETKEKTLKYAETILSAGASILTVHGRQRDQKGHKTGLADWSTIRYLRDNLPPETVLFANGNVLRYEDIQKCLKCTGADGVMSAEGNLCDPSIFAPPPPFDPSNREYFYSHDRKRNGYRMDAVFRRYMDILYTHVLEKPSPSRKPLFMASDSKTSQASTVSDGNEGASTSNHDSSEPPLKKQKHNTAAPSRLDLKKPTSPNLLAMQAHLFHLLRPLVAVHTEVRDALARARAGDMDAFEDVLALTEAATKEGLLDYEAHPERYTYQEPVPDTVPIGDVENGEPGFDHESSVAIAKACKRPWWVCQPYIRPLPKEALEKGSIALSKKEKRQLDVEAARKKMISSHEKQEETEPQKPSASQREKLDTEDGTRKSEVAGEALVCG